MSIGFYLKYKNRDVTALITKVAFKGLVFRRAVGESVLTKYWNLNTQRCKEVADYRHTARRINKRLNEIFIATSQSIDFFVDKRILPSQSEFWEKTDFFFPVEKLLQKYSLPIIFRIISIVIGIVEQFQRLINM